MRFIHFIYLILVITIGISSIGTSELPIILSLFIAPLMAWWGGSGMRGGLHVGNRSQKITGITLGVVFLAISIYWMWYLQTWIKVFNYDITGELWCIIGFFVGFIFTSKADAK